MTITKFSSLTPPAFVRTDVFNAGPPVVMASWANVDGNDILLSNGDYLLQDDSLVLVSYYSAAQYASDVNVKAIVTENVGKELTRNIWNALIQSGVSDANKASIATTITTVMVMILGGQIVSARLLANSLSTTAAFTAGVKTSLLAIMDTAIAKL